MNFFVLTLFAMFVLASMFLGCDQEMKMLKPVVDEVRHPDCDPQPFPPQDTCLDPDICGLHRSEGEPD